MCEPTTIAMAATAAAGAFKMYSQYQEGVASNRYYRSVETQKREEGEAAIKQGQKQSELIQDTAKLEGKSLAEKNVRFKASQEAQMAAQGITGVTAGDIASDTINKQKMDEMVVRYNADVKSWETTETAKYKKWGLETEADQYRFAAKNAKLSSYRDMFGTLLTTAASVASLGAGSGAGASSWGNVSGGVTTTSTRGSSLLKTTTVL